MIAILGSLALLATTSNIPRHANIIAGLFAILCCGLALAIESITIYTSKMAMRKPTKWSWVGGGTVLAVIVSAAVHIAHATSAHKLGDCIATLLLLGLLLITALIGMLGLGLLKHVIPVGTACYSMFALATSAEWVAAPHYSNQLGAVLPVTAGGGVVSVLLVTLIRPRIEEEAAVTPLEKPDAHYAASASGRVTAVLGMVALVALSAFVSLLTLTYVAAEAAKIKPHGGFAHTDRLVAIAAVIAIAWALAAWIAVDGRAMRNRVPLWFLRACCLGLLTALPVILLVDSSSMRFSPFAATVSVIVLLWNFNSGINNISTIQLRPLTIYVTMIAACMSLLGGAITYWSLVRGVGTTSGPRSFEVSAALVIAAIIVHVILMSVVPALEFNSSTRTTEFTIRHNLFQDSLSISAIVLIIEWPVEFLRVSSGQWWLAISLSTGLVPLFATGFTWATVSNREHVTRQTQSKFEADAEQILAMTRAERRIDKRLCVLARAAKGKLDGSADERYIRALSAHVSNQNFLAYAAVLTAIVGAFNILLEGLKDSEWMSHLTALGRLHQETPTGTQRPMQGEVSLRSRSGRVGPGG
jgi:hypothetical protein